MSGPTTTQLILTGALVGASAVAMFLAAAMRAAIFTTENENLSYEKKVYLSADDEEVSLKPLDGHFPSLAIPRDLFGSTDTSSSSDGMCPEFSLSLSVDVFERSVKNVAAYAKWPACYINGERKQRELERLTLYLLGIADTYMGKGPNTISQTPSTHLTVSLLLFCAANLGLPEAYVGGKVPSARRKYGLRSNSFALRIVEDVSKHAILNSIISLYELIILYLLQEEAYDGATLLLKKLEVSNHTRVFMAFIHLATGEKKAYRQVLTDIMSSLNENHPGMAMLQKHRDYWPSDDASSHDRLVNFNMPALCNFFDDPFMGIQ